MRVTQTSLANTFSSNIRDIQTRQAKENIRLTTGKKLTSLSDDPKAVSNIQRYSENIAKNDSYKRAIENALDEQTAAETALGNFSVTLDDVRSLAVDSLQVSNADKLTVFGNNLKQLLSTLVDSANENYNGVYLFSGTKTTQQSLQPTTPETNTLPFELITTTPTASNPSGLEVRFKGDNQERRINVGPGTTEKVSATADETFGGTGNEVFTKVISLYNKLMYKDDGSVRTTPQDRLNVADRDFIQNIYAQIGTSNENVQHSIGAIGNRTQRFSAINEQITADSTSLRQFRSREEDTDVADSILKLQRDDQALQYALQVGSKMFSQSLLDFLR